MQAVKPSELKRSCVFGPPCIQLQVRLWPCLCNVSHLIRHRVQYCPPTCEGALLPQNEVGSFCRAQRTSIYVKPYRSPPNHELPLASTASTKSKNVQISHDARRAMLVMIKINPSHNESTILSLVAPCISCFSNDCVFVYLQPTTTVLQAFA